MGKFASQGDSKNLLGWLYGKCPRKTGVIIDLDRKFFLNKKRFTNEWIGLDLRNQVLATDWDF